jgi:hypothetical protein
MVVPKKKSAAAERKHKARLEEMTPVELLADEIVTVYGDLTPSVERIMHAELSDSQRHRALSLFRESLDRIGDPFRDPRYAIANCGGPAD